MRKTVSVYGLTFSMPMLLWQLIFFLAPLVFLIALSFWSVRNFRMEPDFNPDNWSRMLGRSVFWEAYFRTLLLSASAAVLTSALAFPASYAIAFKLSDAARRWAQRALELDQNMRLDPLRRFDPAERAQLEGLAKPQ